MAIRPHILCTFLLLLSLIFYPGVTQAASVVLVEGDPPLTQETVQQHILLSEWFLGQPFTAEERREWGKTW